jgi:2-polyprenyl-6-methoxyphenol hydroxylase-like FAD-dependent oxidoreductase
MKALRVLVSGAGIAGLTATIGLARHGIRPLVVEQAPDVRADGFIITLSSRCCAVAREMGLLEDLKAAANDVARSSYHDRRGRTLLELDYGELFELGEVVQIMRDDLQSVLYRHAATLADFRFGTSVRALDPRPDHVLASFTDGGSEAFDLVIGADGVHSAVRDRAVAPGAVRRHQLGLHAAAFRAPNVLGLARKYEAYLAPRRHTILYTTRGGDLACIFIWRAAGPAPPTDPAARLAWLARVFEDADPTSRRLIAAATPATRVYMDALVQIEMATWRSGRCVLVGDAAHALTQLSGQGASISMIGAWTLATALATAPFAEACARYERAIRPEVERLQPLVRRNAKWYVPHGALQNLGRELTFRLVPAALWVRYFKTKYASA